MSTHQDRMNVATDAIRTVGTKGEDAVQAAAQIIVMAWEAELRGISEQLGEAIHTALRKASDHPHAWMAWKSIDDLPSDQWSAVLNFVRAGLGLPPRSTR